MTKTTYLEDPEGNGIVPYCESPEDGHFTIEHHDFVTRCTDGTLSDCREPLDGAALFSHLKAEDKLDAPLLETPKIKFWAVRELGLEPG